MIHSRADRVDATRRRRNRALVVAAIGSVRIDGPVEKVPHVTWNVSGGVSPSGKFRNGVGTARSGDSVQEKPCGTKSDYIVARSGRRRLPVCSSPGGSEFLAAFGHSVEEGAAA